MLSFSKPSLTDFSILCMIIIANILAIAPNADINSFPNKLKILVKILSLLTSPFNASCKISLISMSSKNSPVYCFDYHFHSYLRIYSELENLLEL